MRFSNKITLFILFLLICLMIPTVSAFQASCYGRDYSDMNTIASATDAKNVLNGLGYNSGVFTDEDASFTIERMKSDNIFYFHGHANAGLIQVAKTTPQEDGLITASGHYLNSNDVIVPYPYRLTDNLNGVFDDLLLAVYQGCYTANTGVGVGNLLEESNKAGIDHALGFQESLWINQANFWADKFWPYLAQGNNIQNAASMACDDTYLEYISTNGYGGTNSWKVSSIEGTLAIIRPPAAGQFNLVPTPTVTTTIDPIPNAPIAGFTCEYLGDYKFQFTDTSSNSPDFYYWEFDDDKSTSTVKNPIHQFSEETWGDLISVSHAVRNQYGGDTEIIEVNIGENNPCGTPTPTPTITTPTPTSTTPIPTPTPAPNAPVPSFTYTQVANDKMPYTYQFTGSATNNPTSWFWEFGDGTTSRLQSPKQYYSQPGTYTVRLTATNSAGQNTVSQSVNVVSSIPTPTPTPTPPPSNIPQANFVASATEGATPLAIQFVDTSTGSPTAWHWSFGDGSVGSTQQNPVNIYTEAIPNSKTVRLTAENSHGSSYKEITITTYYPFPVAVNNPSTTSGYVPLTVQFAGVSNGAPGTYTWDFGDGEMAYEQNPTHMYTTAGTYTAWFTITDSYGTSEAPQTITVNPAPVTASFTTDVTSGIVPLTVQFADTSAGGATSWDWDFGDGTLFNTTDPAQKSPSHTFLTTNTFTVSLTASNSIGGSTATRQIIVTDTPPPTNIDPVEYTTPGTHTYTIPAGIYSINVTVIGAGGGGGGGNYVPVYSTGNGGFGGNASQKIINATLATTPGSTISLNIGAKGIGGTGSYGPINGNPGNPGGQSSIGSAVAVGGTGGNGGIWSISSSHWDGYPGQDGYGTGQYATSGGSTGSGTGGAGGTGRGAGGGGASGSTLSGGNGADGYVIIYPILSPIPLASFTATPTSGDRPLTVQFTDTSTNTPTSWLWEFGDGATSTEQNPTHTYNTAGNFTVNLTATNAGGSDSFVRTAYITVMPRSIVSAGSVNITQPGEQATMLLTLDSAPDGLGGYNLNLTLSNQSVAQITAVSFPDWASSMNYNSPLPAGQDLVVKASDVNSLVETGAMNIELANITVQGLLPGQTELLLSRTNFDDDNGYDIPHITASGNLTVGYP